MDFINFNAEASCLSTERWLAALEGGRDSEFATWLRIYVDNAVEVGLGLTGSSYADLEKYNPESIDVIKDNLDIFKLIARPFIHDLQIFRSDFIFKLNVMAGINMVEQLFGVVPRIYMPPEFMISNRQIGILADLGIVSIITMPSRFSKADLYFNKADLKYYCNAIPNGRINIFCADGKNYERYLEACQLYNIECVPLTNQTCWRDGESFLFVPDGLAREEFYVKNILSQREMIPYEYYTTFDSHVPELKSYPMHPFDAWSDEMSMLWYIDKLSRFEQVGVESSLQKALLLCACSSDILASVEKSDPVIRLKDRVSDVTSYNFKIVRDTPDRIHYGECLIEMLVRNVELGNADFLDRRQINRINRLKGLIDEQA